MTRRPGHARWSAASVAEVAPGLGGACDAISFLQLDMAPGVTYSDGPTLHACTGAYAVSLSRRLQ